MKRKIIALLLLFSMLGFASFGVDAKSWQKPTYIYGGGLNEDQILSISKTFGIDEGADVLSSPVTGEDLVKYIDGEPTATEDMISSTLVTKKGEGTGVQVEIKTPSNITLVSKEQYANAAITAGVSDVEIFIAAPYPVTGESALSGVYKAFDLNGEDLKKSGMKLAQEELSVTTEITEEAKDKEDFDEAKLSQAILDMKNEIIAAIEKEGGITREEIARIVNEALAKVNLDKVVTQVHIDKLIVYFEQFSKTTDLDFDKIKEQLSTLGKDLAPKIQDLVEDAKASGLWDRIVDILAKIFEAIANIFR